MENVHSAFASVSPLLFLNLSGKLLHSVSFQIPLCFLPRLDDDVGFLFHTARDLDDLLEC